MPDFFRGDYITKERMANHPALIEWISKVGSLDVVSFCVILQNIHTQHIYRLQLMLNA